MSRNAFTHSAFDKQLLRAGVRAKGDWERAIANSGNLTFGRLGAAPFVWTENRWVASVFLPKTQALTLLARNIATAISRTRLPSLTFRHGAVAKVLIGGTLASAAVAAPIAVLAVKGYVDHPASFWQQRLSDRVQSPIFDAVQTLIGSVDTQGKVSADQAANSAYIPLQGPVPETVERGLLSLENKHFYDGGHRNFCGVDLLSIVRPVTSFGRAGGSGIVQQLAKQLKQPDWGDEANATRKAYRWAQQLGASCSLYRTLIANGGKENVVHTYASYAPMWQGNGVLRGLAASSNVVFGLPPHELSDAQQLILAASVKEPLRVAPIEAVIVDCASVYPRVDNAVFDASVSTANKERANQCRVIHRAISMANNVLSLDRLAQALKDLRGYQRDGIQPVNPFEPISTKKLVNLSTRTRAAYGVIVEPYAALP